MVETTTKDREAFAQGLSALANGQKVDAVVVSDTSYISQEKLEWLKSVLPADISLVLKPQDGTTLCAWEKCTKIVKPSRYDGIRKIYCSRRCGNRAAQKAYYERAKAQRQGTPVLDISKSKVNRVKPTNPEIAEELYRKHLLQANVNKGEGCLLATQESAYRCPSRGDPYSERKTCLVYAVLVDDMHELWAKEEGNKYLRRWTSNDGRWLDETEMAGDPHLEASGKRGY